MGCDIHQKTMVWSKVQKKYVDVHEVFDTTDEDEWFPTLCSVRYYELFGVLAGVRGNRFEIYDREDGIPSFCSSTFKKSYEVIGYHNCVWYTIEQLENGLNAVINKITENKEKYIKLKKRYPKRWYDHWFDENPEDEEYEERIYDPDDEYLKNACKGMLDRLQRMKMDQDDWIDKLIDRKKTIIIFYFDS